MRSGKEYIGSSRLLSEKKLTAGTMGTIVIEYTAGKYGIDDRGSFQLAWRGISDMLVPQFDYPDQQGYTTWSSTGNIKIRTSFEKYLRPYQSSIRFQIYDGYLKEGEKLTITIGDKSKGGPGIRLQSFYERELEFVPLVDACGTCRFERVEGELFMEVLPGKENSYQICMPSLVEPGKPFSIGFRAMDKLGNISRNNEGILALEAFGDEIKGLPSEVVFSDPDMGIAHVHGCTVDKEGIYRLAAVEKASGKRCISNPMVCKKDPGLNLYWGDMHGQTRETLGCGTLDDYLSFARDMALIDVTSWQGNDFEITDEAWKYVRERCSAFNEEGKFLVFLGYEWSGTSNAGGDHNIYFLGDSENFYPSSNWVVPGRTSVENNAFPISELFERMHERKDVMATPHIGGRCSNLDFFDPEFIHNIEIHSQHGIFQWFAKEAMKRRYKIGFVATSDDHSGKPGLAYPAITEDEFSGALAVRSGLTGIYAKDLAKESIWDALTHRRNYASTLDRLVVKTDIDGHLMGEEFEKDGSDIKFNIFAAGSDAFDHILIYDWDKPVLRKSFRPKRDALRILFSGVTCRGRNKEARWEGRIRVEGGYIKSAERTGYSLGLGEVVFTGENEVAVDIRTNGEIKGFILELDYDDNTRITVETKYADTSFTMGELKTSALIQTEMGGENLLVEADFANEKAANMEEKLAAGLVEMTYETKAEPGEHAYWMNIVSEDGNEAWSSPIYVKVK